MSALFKERRRLLGIDVYIPSDAGPSGGGEPPGYQAEWHAGRLMAKLADADPDSAEEVQKGRKRLLKCMSACKDLHLLMWPGIPVPLRDALSDSQKKKNDPQATRQQQLRGRDFLFRRGLLTYYCSGVGINR